MVADKLERISDEMENVVDQNANPAALLVQPLQTRPKLPVRQGRRQAQSGVENGAVEEVSDVPPVLATGRALLSAHGSAGDNVWAQFQDQDFYKVKVSGVMDQANILQACNDRGLVPVCGNPHYGDQGCIPSLTLTPSP